MKAQVGGAEPFHFWSRSAPTVLSIFRKRLGSGKLLANPKILRSLSLGTQSQAAIEAAQAAAAQQAAAANAAAHGTAPSHALPPSVQSAVNAAYLANFRRNADRSGYFYWVDFLRAGQPQLIESSPLNPSRFRYLLKSMVNSQAAYFDSTHELNANSRVRLSDTVFIQDVYQNCGGTLVEASGGAHWLMMASSEALASDVIYSMLTGDLTHQPANLNSDEHATAVQRQVTFAK